MFAADDRPPFASLRGEAPETLFGAIATPAYVIEESRIAENCRVLASVMERTGCRILLAQKAFSCFDFYPEIARSLAGTEASGLFEARLGREEMPGKEVHVFCAAYAEAHFEELLGVADHIVFNSPAQLGKFGPRAKAAGLSVGLRINPECSTQEGHAIYDPCAPGSRLGTTRAVWDREMGPERIALLDGLHFHTLCEQNSDALETTLAAVEERFGDILPRMKWLKMGGGHHITRADYDIARLERCVRHAQQAWGVAVYLEPGEAVALNAGYLVCRVLDIVENAGIRTAIVDASAACHMPDVIEMPYTPPLYGSTGSIADLTQGSNAPFTQPHDAGEDQQAQKNGGTALYRLAGPTCLAGDVIGEYLFPRPLAEGDMLVFGDMAIYSMCKNNTFNGMPLPDIWRRGCGGSLSRLTDFGYRDFKMRLGTLKEK